MEVVWIFILRTIILWNTLFFNLSRGNPTKIGDVKHHVFIFELKDVLNLEYKAFCSGNIITLTRILSSAHCFVTNGKRMRRNFTSIRVIAGVLTTVVAGHVEEKNIQFRYIKHIYTQFALRYPAYNLVVVQIRKPWVFNEAVNKISIATMDHDYEGVCWMANARAVESWIYRKHLALDEVLLYNHNKCEDILLRSTLNFFCTEVTSSRIPVSRESEGAGLICYGTDDPQEVNDSGILVGVLSVINVGLPSIHHRVGLYHKWVMDRTQANSLNRNLICILLILIMN